MSFPRVPEPLFPEGLQTEPDWRHAQRHAHACTKLCVRENQFRPWDWLTCTWVLAGPELTHAAVLRLPAQCRLATHSTIDPAIIWGIALVRSDSERRMFELIKAQARCLFGNRYTVTNVVAGKETDGYTL